MSNDEVPPNGVAAPSHGVTIQLPSGEPIVLEYDAYPPFHEIIDMLVEENVALNYWPEIALGYYHLRQYEDFEKLLKYVEEKIRQGSNQAEQREVLRCSDMLAAYYVIRGKALRNEDQKKSNFSKATLLFTAAGKQLMYDADHLIGRAFFCLIESNKLDNAKVQFDYIINLRASDTAAIIGRALINYSQGDYNGALAFFKRALKLKPDLHAEVRLGIGHCYLKLKNFDKAKAAFNRVIEMNPGCLPARLALAVCLAHEDDPIAEEALETAYTEDPANPIILLQLSNIRFLAGKHKEAEDLAFLAYRGTTNPEVKAQASYFIGRCYHAQREFDRALNYYRQAHNEENKEFVLPAYGLGQIYLGKGDFETAIGYFERVLEVHPDDYDTLKVLGSIYARWQGPVETEALQQQQNKAEQLLNKCLEKDPKDVEVLLEIAQIQETLKPGEALKKYETAYAILDATEDFTLPIEMYTNLGALNFRLGNFDASMQNYEKAEEMLLETGDPLTEENQSKLTVVKYNRARCCESLWRTYEAEDIYNDLLAKKGNYLDVILRLGCIWRDRGDHMKAHAMFKDAIGAAPESALPWLFIGNLHMSKGETKLAQSSYEHILKQKEFKDNPYALTGLGNVWLDALFNVRKGDKDEKNKIAKCRENALNCYVKVLKLFPHNPYAANGIACLCISKGQIQDARDIFSQVREALPDFNDVLLSIAHINMENKMYTIASQNYKHYMDRTDGHLDVQLIQYSARAAWKAGNWSLCRSLLQQACLEAPSNLLVRYSLAVVIQCMATAKLREASATTSELGNAVEDLKIAERAFSYLSTQPDDVMIRYRYISRTTCQNEARCCKDLLHQGNQYYTSALKKENEEREKTEQARRVREELLRAKMEAENAAREEQLQREAELRRMRADYIEKAKSIISTTQNIDEQDKEREGKKRGGGRKKKQREEGDEFVNDSSDMGDWRNGEGGEPADGGKRKRKNKDKKKRKRRTTEGGSASEGENSAPKKKRKAKKAVVVEEEPQKNKGKVKSRAYLSSSSSDDSDNARGTGLVGADQDLLPNALSSDSDDSDTGAANKTANTQKATSASGSEANFDSDESAAPKGPAPKRARIVESDEDEASPEGPASPDAPASPDPKPAGSSDSDSD